MGLDQSVYLISARKGLKDIYWKDMPKDLKEASEFLYLRKEYAIQQFVMELAEKKAKTMDDKERNRFDFYGAHIRLTEEDVKALYKITTPEKLREYAERWRGKLPCPYEDWEVEKVKKFCRNVLGVVALGDLAAYYASDW